MKTRADMLMVARGLAPSRARAQAEIRAGNVYAAGRAIERASQAVDRRLPIEMRGTVNPYVSRGALKLCAAVEAFGVSFLGKVVIDLGASTGGFTQVALEQGAARVYAIDVGHGQMHESVRADARVILREGVNARDLEARHAPLKPDIVLADLSFISLTLGLPAALELAAPEAQLIALIKPQFEAGRDRIGKGGIVNDPSVHEAVCCSIRNFLDARGWRVIGLIESPISGGDGNREFLIGAQACG